MVHYNRIPRNNTSNAAYDSSNCLHDLTTDYYLWYISDKTKQRPFLGSISKLLDTSNHSNYTKNRDILRDKDGRPPIWEDNSLEYASQRRMKVHPSTPQLNCRLLHDKHVHGSNVTKWKLPSPLFSPLCPKCNLPDSQQHWITECQHHSQRQIRKDLDNDLETYCNKFKEEQAPLRRFALHMVSLALIPGNTHLWLGNWNTANINLLLNHPTPHKYHCQVTKIIQAITNDL
jgi:hypothetical protein